MSQRTRDRLKRYPKDWKAIVAEVRERSGNRCECTGECGLHNGDLSASCHACIHHHCEWPVSCRCLCHNFATHERSTRCTERHGEPARWARGKVILTTAHLCHDETCRDLEHLRHMCQRCHLRYDQALHQQHALETREARKRAGTLTMFPAPGAEA